MFWNSFSVWMGRWGVVGNWGVTGHKNKSVTKTTAESPSRVMAKTSSLVYFSAVGVTSSLMMTRSDSAVTAGRTKNRKPESSSKLQSNPNPFFQKNFLTTEHFDWTGGSLGGVVNPKNPTQPKPKLSFAIVFVPLFCHLVRHTLNTAMC